MSNPAFVKSDLVRAGSAARDRAWSPPVAAAAAAAGVAKIALLLPENETPRYETNDRPDFEKAVEELCGDCEVIYSNAGGDAEKQQSQAEAALTQGAEVLVVDPVDSKSAAAIAEKAQAQNVPVVSYDRLIENGEVDAYVSFDNEEVGELQAETLAKKLKEDGNPSGPIIMINGDPADPNAALFKAGAHNGFEAAGVEDRQGIRHARLDRRKRPARGAAGDHRARQQRVRRHLRRQRRHRRRRDRGDEGRRHQPRRKAGHRPGRDRGRPAAHPRRPAVHDDLQGDRAGGRDRRRNRGRPRRRRRSARRTKSPKKSTTARSRSRRSILDTGRGDQRQRQEHGRRRRVRRPRLNSAPAPTQTACKEAGICGLRMSPALRSSSWRESASDSARSRLWTGSTSPSTPARSSAWSATTAPASRRW